MTAWLVRPEGSTRRPAAFPTAQAVVDALKDGDVSTADEVRGPSDGEFRPIEAHPTFAEVAADLDQPPPAPEEETHLDMNPLIDVALVLLIFFILTASYSTLTRTLALPPEPSKDGGQSAKSPQEIRSQAVTVKAGMVNGKPAVTVEGKPVELADLERELTALVKASGRKDAILDVGPGVPWGVSVALFDAAAGAEVRNVIFPKRTPAAK